MELLKKDDKIFVAGHRGLVGSALVEELQKRGYKNLLLRTRKELNLLSQDAVQKFFREEKPDVAFVAAGRVGGIHANSSYRADFIYENLLVESNVIWEAHQNRTRRLIFLGSSCIYPRNAPQPMPESCLQTSPLEYTNRPYAVAKIAGLELVDSLRKQFSRDFFSVMPTNLYGPRDNYHPENSHALPALVQRIYRARETNQSEVMVWGSGKPLREFMFSHDCADAIIFLAENLSDEELKNSTIGQAGWSHINIGSGHEISTGDLGKLVARLVGYKGTITFDPSKPDGTPRKLLDSSFLHRLGWKPKTSLEEGIRQSIAWFEKNIADR